MSAGCSLVATECEEEAECPSPLSLRIETSPSSRPSTCLRPNLRRSIWDGGFYGVMVGMGETYLPAFALATGTGEVTAGLMVGVPMLIGGLVQLATHHGIRWSGSNKRWIVIASLLQAVTFLPLIVAACVGWIPTWNLFAIATWYWALGMSAGPAWNTWIGHLVPAKIRPNYFAKRTRLIQLTTFGSFLLGGVILSQSAAQGHLLWGFAVLFGLALVSRIVSVLFLASHQEPHLRPHQRLLDHSQHVSSRVGPNLVLYLVCMQFFVQMSGPYFVPFMMKKLEFSYPAFVILTGSAFIAKALSMPLWGAVAQRTSSRMLLVCGGIGIIPLSFLWTLSDDFSWLVATQVVSGLLWAAYELGFFLVFVNDVAPSIRSRLMTKYNLWNSVAWFSGSMLGGLVLTLGQASHSSYHLLFTLSMVGRIVCLFLLWRLYHAAPLSATANEAKADPQASPRAA